MLQVVKKPILINSQPVLARLRRLEGTECSAECTVSQSVSQQCEDETQNYTEVSQDTPGLPWPQHLGSQHQLLQQRPVGPAGDHAEGAGRGGQPGLAGLGEGENISRQESFQKVRLTCFVKKVLDDEEIELCHQAMDKFKYDCKIVIEDFDIHAIHSIYN